MTGSYSIRHRPTCQALVRLDECRSPRMRTAKNTVKDPDQNPILLAFTSRVLLPSLVCLPVLPVSRTAKGTYPNCLQIQFNANNQYAIHEIPYL